MADETARTGGESQPASRDAGGVFALEKALLTQHLRKMGSPPLRIVLWDGQAVEGSSTSPKVTMHFHTRKALVKTLIDPGRYFGDGYADGTITVEGDLREFVRMVYRSTPPRMRARDWIAQKLRRGRNSLAGSQRNIHHHYDIGNDFYKLWLDERMVYTCAYYADAAMDLKAAQLAKMDHVARKLQLKPGQKVVEAGCGWGALAMHMAEHYDVQVRAFNISTEQIKYAREQAERRGIADRVEFVQDDYRNIEGECDAFVSVGMLEHVGLDNYRKLGAVIDRTLKPGGRGLIHTIGRHRPMQMNAWIDTHIFPGACPPTLTQMMPIFEPYHLAVLDVENLRLHYERTLTAWLERFEQHADDIREMFDDRFVRMWRLYLAGSAEAFQTGLMHLYQVVFARYDDNTVPATREHLYGQTQGSERAAM